jgi:DNA-binding winged helix-turn-helix (wHTH) protein
VTKRCGAALGSCDVFVMSPDLVVYTSLDLRVDPAAFVAERGGRRLDLEPKAFELLVLLLANAGRLLTKQEILDAVWAGTAVTDNALTRVVAQLRKALGDDAREARFLETVPTKGYRWIAPVEGPAEGPAEAGHYVRASGFSRKAQIATVLGAVVLALGWVLWQRTRSDEPRSLFPVQVTVSTGVDMYPALSADGERLAFTSDRSGAWEIYVKDARAGATERALTSDGAQNVQPAWSPDGAWIAFHSMQRGGIWIAPAAGGAPRQVADFGSRPAWSPDGTRLAFQSDAAGDIGP